MGSSGNALLSFLVIFLLCSISSANYSNILVSGDVLATGEELFFNSSAFIIHHDCNLALYNDAGHHFQSNTSGRGTNCTLTLSDYGQLIITDVINSKIVWSSPRAKGHSKGQYAAILQPDGEVGIYGPAVWSSPRLASKEFSISDGGDKISGDDARSTTNLLFSSEVLKEGSKVFEKSASSPQWRWPVVSREYTLEVTKECGLQLTKSGNDISTAVWTSPRFPARENCFARLNSHGQLALLDDDSDVLWSSRAGAKKGLYVLAVKIDGQTAVYGPRFWST